MSLPSHESIFSRYTKKGKLGEGTYGVVYRAKSNETGQEVAIKVMRLDEEEEGIASTAMREIAILRKLKHPNIVSLIEADVQDQQLTIVLEFLQTDIRKYLKSKAALPPKLICSYAFQLLAGVYYMHTHRVIHRDIKPENLLIDRSGYMKICDFGLSRFFTVPITQYTENTVTLWYRAPEILLHNPVYDISVDIWSVGCVVAEMVRKKALFPGDSVLDEVHIIFNILGSPSPELCQEFHDLKEGLVCLPSYQPKNLTEVLGTDDENLVDLLSKMLIIDPKKRISAKEALKHPYFNLISENTRRKFLPPDFYD